MSGKKTFPLLGSWQDVLMVVGQAGVSPQFELESRQDVYEALRREACYTWLKSRVRDKP